MLPEEELTLNNPWSLNMGLTIHYDLKGIANNDAAMLVAKLAKRVLDLPFTEVGEIVDLSGRRATSTRATATTQTVWLLIQAGRYIEMNKALKLWTAPTLSHGCRPRAQGALSSTFGLSATNSD